MERELAELRGRQAIAVENTGPGVAFAGDRNFVNTGSIVGSVQVVRWQRLQWPPRRLSSPRRFASIVASDATGSR